MALEGKRIVITGVASGIGAASAAAIKSQGAEVIGVDLNQPGAHTDQFVRADLADEASIAAAAEAIEGPVDALCNIAGLPPTHSVEKVLQVNFLGLRSLTRAMLPKINDGGSIVNMASVAGLGWSEDVERIRAFFEVESTAGAAAFAEQHGVGAKDVYPFTKAALIVWTLKSWNSFSRRGIRMNAISPGPVDTPILPDFMATLGARVEEDMGTTPRPGKPEEIAPAVAFLADPDSAWVSGFNLCIDGGLSAALSCKARKL